MTIDTLEYVKRLEAAGVDRRQAEAHAAAVRDTVAPQLATKADIDGVRVALERHREATKADIDNAVARIESKLGTEVARLESKLGTEVARLNAKLGTEVGRLDAKIDTVAGRLDAKMDALASRFEMALWKHTAGLIVTTIVVAGVLLRFLR
jgi:hypothetical protein